MNRAALMPEYQRQKYCQFKIKVHLEECVTEMMWSLWSGPGSQCATQSLSAPGSVVPYSHGCHHPWGNVHCLKGCSSSDAFWWITDLWPDASLNQMAKTVCNSYKRPEFREVQRVTACFNAELIFLIENLVEGINSSAQVYRWSYVKLELGWSLE